MASIHRRKATSGGKAAKPRLPAKSISRHDDRFKFDGLDWIDQSIVQLADENRRLEILAENLRADIVRMVTRQYSQH